MISPETIALVKERTDLVALIGETVRLTRKGRTFTGLCPFHKEKTPSFHVNQERGFFHCFGCKESGSAVDFQMKALGMAFPDAVRELAERAGIAIAETTTDAEQREAQAARRARDDLYAVNGLAATFFEQNLREGGHPLAHHARTELARRGLALKLSAEGDEAGVDPVANVLQAFRVGYAPLAWDGLVAFLRQQGVSPIAAEKVGLLVPRSSGTGHYDRFRHRLMFAVIDVMGRVVAFSGRALPDPEPHELGEGAIAPRAGDEHASPAKYINSPESPIYTKGEHLFGLHQAKSAVRMSGEAVLVEGNFDVVALHARGVGNVVAPLGTAFTAQQAKLLKRFAPSVVVLFDGDAAGRKATRAARQACREGGLTAKVARLPDGIDPDDYAQQHGPKGVARLLRSAKGMLEYLVDDTLDSGGFEGASLHEQLARVRAVAELLGEEDDPNMRQMAKHYADRVSAKLVIQGRSPDDMRQLERLIEDATRPSRDDEPRETSRKTADPEQGPRARSRSAVDEIGWGVLGALIDFPELLEDPEVEEALGDLDGDAALAVAAMRQSRSGQKGLYAAEFLAQIPPPIHSFAAGRLALPGFEAPDEARASLLKNARKLKRLSLSRQNAVTIEELHQPEVLGDIAAENALLRELARRSREKLGLE